MVRDDFSISDPEQAVVTILLATTASGRASRERNYYR